MNFGSAIGGADSIASLAQIERYTQDANELMRTQFLQNVWHFEDLHKPEAAPDYIHRIKCEVKHMASNGEKIIICNNL